jgi:hypothetical protein
MSLTTKQIFDVLRKTKIGQGIIKRSQDPRISIQSIKKVNDGVRLVVAEGLTDIYEIELLSLEDNPKKVIDSKIWVSCDCPFHLYFCEYALTKQGNSAIIYSNGQPPVERNPREYPIVCKHTLVALNRLKNKIL